ncbi:hypothetical protein [Nocardiopsis sp. CC223A]|uniref:hypothetical protein n=1 Tax=Nocardiopsis sp. CC223A TaxID=3044051 RepID=UPI00278BC40E|nr:hypothetical protein [Nocardiopsis sp. CC223A]
MGEHRHQDVVVAALGRGAGDTGLRLPVLRLPLRDLPLLGLLGLTVLGLVAVLRLGLLRLAVGLGAGRRREAGLTLSVLRLLCLRGLRLRLGLSVTRLFARRLGAVLLVPGLRAGGLSVLLVPGLRAGGLSVARLLVARLFARRLGAVLLVSGLCAGGLSVLLVPGLRAGRLSVGGVPAGRLCAVLLMTLLPAGRAALLFTVFRGVGGRRLRLLAGGRALVRVLRGRGVRRGLAHALPWLR